jgi:hypothetical protein
VPLEYAIVPAAPIDPVPVPPLPTPRVPVISAVDRFTAADDRTPDAFALTIPVERVAIAMFPVVFPPRVKF